MSTLTTLRDPHRTRDPPDPLGEPPAVECDREFPAAGKEGSSYLVSQVREVLSRCGVWGRNRTDICQHCQRGRCR